MALRRINKELQDLSQDPPANCSAGPIGKQQTFRKIYFESIHDINPYESTGFFISDETSLLCLCFNMICT